MDMKPIIEADANSSPYIIEGSGALPGGTARSRVMIAGSHSGLFKASIELSYSAYECLDFPIDDMGWLLLRLGFAIMTKRFDVSAFSAKLEPKREGVHW